MAKVLPTNNLIEFESREELAPQMNSACIWRMVCSSGPYDTDGDSFAFFTCNRILSVRDECRICDGRNQLTHWIWD